MNLHVETATFPQGPPPETVDGKRLTRWAQTAITAHARLRNPTKFVGAPGIGKSRELRRVVQDAGYYPVVLPAGHMSAGRLAFQYPYKEGGRMALRQILDHRISRDDEWVLIVEEAGKADAALAGALLEIVEAGSLNGEPLPGIRGVLAADNPDTPIREAALASRFVHVRLGPDDTPWEAALAAAFPDVDLNRLIAWVRSQPRELREQLPGRTLQRIVVALLGAVPPKWAVRRDNRGRQRLMVGDRDRTNEVLAEIAGTLDVGVARKPRKPVERAIRVALEGGLTVALFGDAGVGKSSHAEAACRNLGYDVIQMSLSASSPGRFFMRLPDEQAHDLHSVHANLFARVERPTVVILDDLSRTSDKQLLQIVHELLQEREIGGQPINPHIAGFVVTDNGLRSSTGRRHGTQRLDSALLDRFSFTLTVDEQDVGGPSWFLGHAAEADDELGLDGAAVQTAEKVLSWFATTIDAVDDARDILSMRTALQFWKAWLLHRIVEPSSALGDLEIAQAAFDDEGAGIDVHSLPIQDLLAALAGLRVMSLGDYARELDETLHTLATEDTEAAALMASSIRRAVAAAPTAVLVEHEEAVGALLQGLFEAQQRDRAALAGTSVSGSALQGVLMDALDSRDTDRENLLVGALQGATDQ